MCIIASPYSSMVQTIQAEVSFHLKDLITEGAMQNVVHYTHTHTQMFIYQWAKLNYKAVIRVTNFVSKLHII